MCFLTLSFCIIFDLLPKTAVGGNLLRISLLFCLDGEITSVGGKTGTVGWGIVPQKWTYPVITQGCEC
jgi:hypothetical protein